MADFNQDGTPDLAVANSTAYGRNDVSILLGNGGGTFQPARNLDTGGNAVAVVAGDFNGDGIPDLAVADL
ncbi:MAG TPA: VCBS repeat-containing protein, partial [Gemmataceae bacterium]|nr:VCBS repeat-containing protein [Gemmataceae bacterium]